MPGPSLSRYRGDIQNWTRQVEQLDGYQSSKIIDLESSVNALESRVDALEATRTTFGYGGFRSAGGATLVTLGVAPLFLDNWTEEAASPVDVTQDKVAGTLQTTTSGEVWLLSARLSVATVPVTSNTAYTALLRLYTAAGVEIDVLSVATLPRYGETLSFTAAVPFVSTGEAVKIGLDAPDGGIDITATSGINFSFTRLSVGGYSGGWG